MQESSKSSTDYLNDTTDSKALRWELVEGREKVDILKHHVAK